MIEKEREELSQITNKMPAISVYLIILLLLYCAIRYDKIAIFPMIILIIIMICYNFVDVYNDLTKQSYYYDFDSY